MAYRAVAVSLAALSAVLAQTTISDDRTADQGPATTTALTVPTGSYSTETTQVTLGTDLGDVSSSTEASNATASSSTSRTTLADDADTATFLTGSVTSNPTTFAGNFSMSATSTAAPTPSVVNTQPCNNYPEFCSRKYSNITYIACHNSPFILPNNLAANQQFDVTSQLNDGVRFLQAQIQFPKGVDEPHFCHTSCDILDAGPIVDWLTQVKNWVASHPYDVVTILLGNGNYSPVEKFVPYIQQSGLLRYVYKPKVAPMTLDDWPTLNDMILRGQRVVMFMDYNADQQKFPWLLDEFSQVWETPFDPTNQSFPCTVQRPPDLKPKDAKNRLYLLNHNLNIELSLLGTQMPVPARAELNLTNSATGFGSLGQGANNCLEDWGRAPNFLNVDYYNYGNYPGSVFEVAAKMNNVAYNRTCCGQIVASGASGTPTSHSVLSGVLAMALMWCIL